MVEGVWNPPTPVLSKSRRHDSRVTQAHAKKGGFDYASFSVSHPREKRSIYKRRLSEDSDFTHVLGNFTDDDDDSYQVRIGIDCASIFKNVSFLSAFT